VRIAVIGGGISGLATAWNVLRDMPAAEVTVFEESSRAGGKVLSEMTHAGYLCEWGVNGFLDKVPETLELCRQVGVTPLGADAAAKRRYVFSEGELHALPEKPPQFLTSKLLSARGKLRVGWEWFAGGTEEPDETLAAFGRRRLGREAFEKLIDPMASGVFAGDPERMSLKSCFPRIHEIESEYGSLIRGLVALQKQARKSGAKNKPGPGPGGLLTSFEGGMSVLTDSLAALLGERVRLATPVAGIEHAGSGFRLDLGNGSVERFDRVVLACPAWAQAELLSDLAPRASQELRRVPYPPVTVVCMGYDVARLETPPDGFGFLVPSRERRDILGTVFDSNVFPGRAPAGRVLLRTLVGGMRDPAPAELDDARLTDRVASNLAEMAGIRTQPEFVQIYRHQRAIPQYTVGHGQRLARIDEAVKGFPGLVLTGNAYRGVSLNDCVLNAQGAARAALTPRA
jgi:oxygen-dependent protoporphyrinogen oxidase